MSLINIGESVKHLVVIGFSEELSQRVIGIRNIAAHDFEALKMGKVWEFLQCGEYGGCDLTLASSRLDSCVV